MTWTKDTERFIYSRLSRYITPMCRYREDALQEIRFAIAVSDSEEEALRCAHRMCEKMLRQYGLRRGQVMENYRQYLLSGLQLEEAEEVGGDALEEIKRLYLQGWTAKQICSRFNAPYKREINSLLIESFIGGITANI